MSDRLFSKICRNARERRTPTGTLRLFDSEPKMTQERLAALRNCDQSLISKVESGAEGVAEETLEATAEALGISVRQLLLEELDPKRAAKEWAEGVAVEWPTERVLGRILANFLRRHAVSQAEAKKRTGVAQSMISALASGRTPPRNEEVLAKIAQGFGMTLEDLLLDGLTYEPPRAEKELGEVWKAFESLTRARLVAACATGEVVAIDLAQRIGIHRSALSRFVSGASLAPESLLSVAHQLETLCPLAELIGRINPRNAEMRRIAARARHDK